VFDIGPEKLLFVLTIALAVLGPERIPHVARGLGRARAEIRRLTSDIHPDALQALSNPRGALLDAVTEPRRAISEAVAQPRLALADAIADFKFTAGLGDAAGPGAAEPASSPADATISPAATPDDPAFN
jgi:sec-independent protein translocase protein TatB